MTAEKKQNAVVFGLTSDHVFAVACVMMDIKRLSPGMVDEVVVLHDGISSSDQQILNSILPTRFIFYDFPLNDPKVLYAKSVQHFTKMVFTKFECLKLLDDYKNVMWLDYDIVVQADISELYSRCDGGLKIMPGGLKVRGQLLENVGEYDMEREGMCASLFVFQDHLENYRELYRFCYEKLQQYAEVLYMPEQAIFDFMLQAYDLKPVAIDARVYSPHPTDLEHAHNARIIHAFGQPKFWNGLSNLHWDSNYQTWLDMGGSQYIKPRLINKLQKRANSLIRQLWSTKGGLVK